jgi:hypothetical protein
VSVAALSAIVTYTHPSAAAVTEKAYAAPGKLSPVGSSYGVTCDMEADRLRFTLICLFLCRLSMTVVDIIRRFVQSFGRAILDLDSSLASSIETGRTHHPS